MRWATVLDGDDLLQEEAGETHIASGNVSAQQVYALQSLLAIEDPYFPSLDLEGLRNFGPGVCCTAASLCSEATSASWFTACEFFPKIPEMLTWAWG